MMQLQRLSAESGFCDSYAMELLVYTRRCYRQRRIRMPMYYIAKAGYETQSAERSLLY